MSITAKELARIMGLSEAAISMALNNKPGVSTKTRKKVLQKATELGYDFSRLSTTPVETPQIQGTINFVVYRKSGAVVPFQGNAATSMDIPFFSQLSEGIDTGCKQHHFYLHISYVYEDDDLDELLSAWKSAGVRGLIVLGTEMDDGDIKPFLKCQIPIVLLDNYFDNRQVNSIMINNVQGAYLATRYLIRRKQCQQPGYLHSSYSITGFEERGDGFYKALRWNGLSTSQAIVHRLTPSLDGAYSDMKYLLQHGERLARCYFADNDQIAAGAMRAFLEAGYRVPEDISIIGFDDMPLCTFVTPALSTVHVPKEYMGELAVNRLVEIMNHPSSAPVKIEISTELLHRKSC